jgi:hypothetical protein
VDFHRRAAARRVLRVLPMKLLETTVLALALALSLSACVDEGIEEVGPEPTGETDEDAEDPGIAQNPDLVEDEDTCGARLKADGECVPE